MNVTRISLRDFRNIAEAELCPGPGVNIIHGGNAQGKTNILEAIWLFTGGRSFRGAKDAEFIRFSQSAARLHVDFEAGGRPQTADIAFGTDNKKKVLLNEISQERASALAGRFFAVVFSPDQLSMVKQGPERRRRFVDTSLCQILPKYHSVLDSYERILRQRARLLRDCAHHSALLDQLDSWDSHLAGYGAYISEVRVRYVRKLAESAREVYTGITAGRERFSLHYKSTAAEELPASREAWRELLAEAVKESRGEDLRTGATTVGPHRDDLVIEVDGVSARSFASQGQQRSCVLALKLAECALMGESAGETPVVLLDDVMSELDESRRAYLLNHLEGRQVFITCCDAEAFAGLGDGRIFDIRAGDVIERK